MAPATYPNAVKVTAPSSLASSGTVTFGNLSVSSSSLSVAGGGLLGFSGATTVSGSPTFNVPSGMRLVLAGPVSDGGTGQTITESGGGYLILSGTSGSFVNGSHFQVNGSSLVAVGQNYTAPSASGPLGSTAITLNNGALVLAATTSSGAATFNMVSGNALSLSGTLDTILAAAGPGGAPAVSNGTIILAGSSPIAILANQTLSLGVSNGYTLNVGTVFSNSGTIVAGVGNVSLAGSSLTISTGTLGGFERRHADGGRFHQYRHFCPGRRGYRGLERNVLRFLGKPDWRHWQHPGDRQQQHRRHAERGRRRLLCHQQFVVRTRNAIAQRRHARRHHARDPFQSARLGNL